jgi:uncharacterized protein YbjQ (UPF0145 family)
MGFFGTGSGKGQMQQPMVATTVGGVPQDAIARLRRTRGEGGPALFTSDLSVSEFVLLREMEMQPLGFVLGSSIYHVGFQLGNYFVNQELNFLSQAMYEARELAMTRMEEEAEVLDADGIVGVSLQVGSYGWAPNALEFTAVGTAIKTPEGQSYRRAGGRPFTCDLSVQDFYKLTLAGYRPVQLVIGSCVYHIAHQGFMQAMKTVGNNIELPNYTEAIYEARELAMSRMQAEAEGHDAAGVVGVDLSSRSHIWETHVLEFLAIGTSIVSRGGAPAKTSPALQLSLDD